MNHSIAQLILLAEAAHRLDKRARLAHGQMTLAGVAGCLTKEGAKAFRKIERDLRA